MTMLKNTKQWSKKKKYINKCFISKANLFKSQLITGPVFIVDRGPVLIDDPDTSPVMGDQWKKT